MSAPNRVDIARLTQKWMGDRRNWRFEAMATNGTINYQNVPAEFEEAGIKPLAYGQPELPKATAHKALARQIERDGLKDEAGNELAKPDAASAEGLARMFVYPRTAAAALKAPLYKHLQAGTVALVHGVVFLTRINPSLLNPRVSPMLAIPRADSNGRVAAGWAPFDVSVDLDAKERLMQASGSLDELVESSRQTADKVLALQQDLSKTIGREGIEEPLLIVQTRLDIGGGAQPVRDRVPIAADGGSRITIGQEHLADAITRLLSEKETFYATKHKRRGALEELERSLRAHQPASLVDDPIAERELRDYLVELSGRPAAELVDNGMYAAQRALVAPAMVVVGFRPNGDATIIDAIDQLVANQHKRGPLQWVPAARALDSRNSVVRALRRQAVLGEGKALLLGPRYEEATKKFDITDHPDFRIGEVVRVFHGDEARKPIRDAIGAGRSEPSDRGEIIAAVIGEQLRNADPAFRRDVETTLRDIVVHPPFYGANVPEIPKGSDPDPDELVEKVMKTHEKDPKVLTEHHVELGVKGGVALAMLGALRREHGAPASEVVRPYTVVQRLLRDSFGQELLGEAIQALRDGKSFLPARNPETKELKGRDAENRVVPMDANNLREVAGAVGSGEAGDDDSKTPDEILAELKSAVRNTVGELLKELKEHSEVTRAGVAPQKAKELTDLLMEQALDVEYLGRRGGEQLKISEEDKEAGEVAA
jgi:hypothetical protein